MSFISPKKILGALLLVAVMFAVFPAHFASTAPQEIDLRIDELQGIQNEIDAIQKQLTSKTSAEKSVLAELTRLESQLALATKELNYIEIQLSVTDEQLKQTRAEVAEMEQKLESQKAALDSRLVSMYKTGRVSYVDILLSSGSLSELLTRVHYLKEIAVKDTALIDEYGQARAVLVARRTELEEYNTKLLGLKSTQEIKRAEVTSRSKDRETYLAGIQADKDRLVQALDQMQKEAEALNKVIADLQAKGQKPQAHPLQMIWPSTDGWISDEYGWRYHPILNYNKFHAGIDIAVNTGTPVKAAEDGTVIFSGVNGGYGNCVILDHGDNVSTLYGHNSKLLVKVGQDVLKGQTIAQAGATGLATGPHIHFEVRVNGETQEPRNWLPPR